MLEALDTRLDRIEGLLVQINSRIENFLGQVELTAEEELELAKIEAEAREKGTVGFHEAFPMPVLIRPRWP